MNLPDTEGKSASGGVVSNEARTRLSGSSLILARVAWVVVVTLLVVLFLAMLPAYYTLLQTVCTGAPCGLAQPTPDSALTLQRLGFSLGAYATIPLALTSASACLCLAVGAVIFCWRCVP